MGDVVLEREEAAAAAQSAIEKTVNLALQNGDYQGQILGSSSFLVANVILFEYF